jgi:glycosyltransferase involved in cell wall biosynthesis
MNGIGRYQRETIKALSSLDIDIRLFTDRALDAELAPFKANKTLVSYVNSRLLSQIWSQTALPIQVNSQKVDIFWGPAHRIPLFLPAHIPTVLTIHDLVWKHASNTMRGSSFLLESILTPRAIKRADKVIAVSASTAKDIALAYPDAKNKVRVVPLAPSLKDALQDATVFKNLNLNPKKPYVLFVGTLEPRKNLARLIHAYSLIPKALINNYQLVIVGAKGWGDIKIENIVQEYSLQEHCVIANHVTDNQLAALYAKAYCHLMPSIYEGFGLPIIEANSFGVPVITSNTSAMPEVSGDSAILVDPFNVMEISQAIELLLSNSGLRQSLSEKSVINAQRFDWRVTARQTLEVFKEAIEFKRHN